MDKSLTLIVEQANRQNPGSVVLGSELRLDTNSRITSGSLSLDVALGGGWPANHWHEVYGEFSSGKTCIILKTIAANQRIDPEWRVWWLASEDFDPDYARLCGVDLSRIHLHDTNVMEEGFQKILEVAKSRQVDCIVIDSLPQLVPTREDNDDIDKSAPGLAALVTNKFFRKQGSATRRSLTSVDRPITGFVVNQFREKIGVMYGDSRTTPGGKGKDFAYFVRLEVKRDEWIKEGDEPVGQVIKAVTRKNKSARPQRVATVAFYFADCGDIKAGEFDTISEIVAQGVNEGVLKRGGAWIRYGEQQWQGRQAMADALRADPVLAAKISHEVLTVLHPHLTPPEPPSPPARKPRLIRKVS